MTETDDGRVIVVSDKTLLIGDSTSDGIREKFPSEWIIDAEGGRPIRALNWQIEDFLNKNPAPRNFVMALGTNRSSDPDWSKERLVNAIDKFPVDTRVFFMMVVRCGEFQAWKDEVLKDYNRWSRELSVERPRSFIVDWRGRVLADDTLNHKTGISSLLRDGTHQTDLGGNVYVNLIRNKIASV